MTGDIIVAHASPNYDVRAGGRPVDMLLLHYTGMTTGAEALARLCDENARVSAHYLIEEDGRIYGLVPEARRAWHAGLSSWAGEADINSCSIGIELVNPGHAYPGYMGGYRPFPKVQMAALIELAQGIVKRHAIPQARVLGHSDVAPARKTDPGELFDWQALAIAGVGVWPQARTPSKPAATLCEGDSGPEVVSLKKALASYGYGIGEGAQYDTETTLVVTAFQRHFRPRLVDGIADSETQAVLQVLLGR
jgi:N-acetylmuramoyl-L-alanine amidase